MEPKIVITGMGIQTSNANNVAEFEQSLRNGVTGQKPVYKSRFNTEESVYRNNKACVIPEERYVKLKAEDPTILTKISVETIQEAIDQAGLQITEENHKDIGLCLATSVGGSYPFMDFLKTKINEGVEQTKDELLLYTTPTIGGNIMKEFGIKGPLSVISIACASGTNSIGRAFDLVRKGKTKVMIAGGVDIFTELTYSGFNALQAISRTTCMSFDEERDGLILGDGSAFVVVETEESAKERGAEIIAAIGGYSTINEAYHATAPHPEGIFAHRAMSEAIDQAGINIGDVDYINAHGTGTKANDAMEMKAIGAFIKGKPTYVSSTKSMLGHCLGAAGSVEFIAGALAVQKDFIPPSINVSNEITIDSSLELVKEKSINHTVNHCVSNSFGFAGNMSSIVISKSK